MNLVEPNKKVIWPHIAILILAVCAAYMKVFHAPFAANDDAAYVVNNPDIRSFAWDNVSKWFSSYYVGNYQPLTMLSYAIDFAVGGSEPFIYHFSSVLLHCLNAVLLYLLLKRISGQTVVALLVALLFALHPSQTESVSWIAERKTLLCGFFSVLALYIYAGYIARTKLLWLTAIVGLSILAMLSKAVAVSLPFSFLAVDIWMRRDMRNAKVWLEKIPVLLCSVIIGIIAIRAQSAGHFIDLHPASGFRDKLLLAANANMLYLLHMVLPVRLSVIYPFPDSLGILQYICLAGSMGLVTLGIVSWKKKWYILCGGILLYVANIFPVLQFVQFGDFLMADRYMYLACIGVFFPLVFYSMQLLQKRKTLVVTGYALAATVLLAGTYSRNDIWLSELNFFTAILDTFPDSPSAQYSVGGLYMSEGKYDEAEPYIDKALQLAPRNHVAWYNKGVLDLRKNRVNEALADFDKCIALRPYADAFFSRAVIYMGTGKYAQAQADAQATLHDQPHNARAWYIAGFSRFQQGDASGAIGDYTQSIMYDAAEPMFYTGRADALLECKHYPEAIADLSKAIAMNPQNGELYFKRAQAKMYLQQDGAGDMNTAMALGYRPSNKSQKLK